MTPSNFTTYPWASVLRNSESEIVAQNIMKILERTGNTFRVLPFSEYKEERLKDSGFSDLEERYFYNVVEFCSSEESAKRLSPEWNKI